MFNVGDIVLAKEGGFPDVIGPIVSIDFDRDWPIRVRTEKADIGFKPEQLTAVSAQQANVADAQPLDGEGSKENKINSTPGRG